MDTVTKKRVLVRQKTTVNDTVHDILRYLRREDSPSVHVAIEPDVNIQKYGYRDVSDNIQSGIWDLLDRMDGIPETWGRVILRCTYAEVGAHMSWL